MEGIDLTLAEEALGAIARKAIDRKTGARGLRSIMEGILLDTMFDLPSLEGVEGVMISKEVVEGTARPLYIYAARADASVSYCGPGGAPPRCGVGLLQTSVRGQGKPQFRWLSICRRTVGNVLVFALPLPRLINYRGSF